MSLPKDGIYDPSGDVLLVLSRKLAGPLAANEQSTRSKTILSQARQLVEEVEVKVSSRHLALASPVFRVMFDGDFSERIQPGCTKQPARVPLPDDDYDAMLILLAIVHGRNRVVPRQIDTKIFVRVVVLIDKYEMSECTEVHMDIWFNELFPMFSTTPEWVFVYWVLRKAAEFRFITERAITDCRLPFEDDAIPLLPSIIGELESRRISIIDHILTELKAFLDRYISGVRQRKVTADCDSMVLGELIKNLAARNLFPVPEAATINYSVTRLISLICTMDVRAYAGGGVFTEIDDRSRRRLFNATFDPFAKQASGLKLTDYILTERATLAEA